ncbi:unnamed protein product [Macrosiphum euphorbiae]|uniref:Uncharacterized protein n=1 Tax=Macrosiphum euphorbiae TaxID=13131 RepID=A0AAV0WA78_9HEMI|nr:unnamed protein product [Macrosiphum euphorbiae]
MAKIMTVNDIENNFIDSSDEVDNDIPDINNEDVEDDDSQKDSDDEYLNDGTSIANEDIENELFFDLFNTGKFIIRI